MAQEQSQWYIDLVKARYQYLDITWEQAEKIHQYEEDKDIYSDKHVFSFWEELDYELTTFQEILTEDQLSSYRKSLNKNIENYEQSLSKLDKENPFETAYYDDLTHFYKTIFLPDLIKNPLLNFGWLLTDQAKIDYLKSEYQKFLNDVKKEILTSHFRHNRLFKPNELKSALLRHNMQHVMPDYHSFKYKMDDPTKVVAFYLESKLEFVRGETMELIETKFTELDKFTRTTFKNHYGEVTGWHIATGYKNPEEERKHRIMSILLLNK